MALMPQVTGRMPSTPLAMPPEHFGVRYFEPMPPAVRFERILRIQGYSDLDRVRPAISNAAREMAALASTLSQPRTAYRYVPVRSLSDETLELEAAERFFCRAFASRLADCFEVAPVLIGIGAALGQRIVELAEAGDLLEAVLLETGGWLCIEDATRQFTSHLRNEVAARDCHITSRLGPGYSYRLGNDEVTWPLEEQPALFGLFGNAELPVSLMSSCAMSPKLSRSGLYGIRPLRPPIPLRAASLLN